MLFCFLSLCLKIYNNLLKYGTILKNLKFYYLENIDSSNFQNKIFELQCKQEVLTS